MRTATAGTGSSTLQESRCTTASRTALGFEDENYPKLYCQGLGVKQFGVGTNFTFLIYAHERKARIYIMRMPNIWGAKVEEKLKS